MKVLFISAANSVHTVRWVNALVERKQEVILVPCQIIGRKRIKTMKKLKFFTYLLQAQKGTI